MTTLISSKVSKTDFQLILRRIGAYFVDVTLLMVLMQGAQWGLFVATGGFPFNQIAAANNGWLIYGWVLLTVSLPIWLYFVLQERTARRATLGKRLLGVQVTAVSGQAATTTQLLARTILKLLLCEMFHLAMMLPTPLFAEPNPAFRPGILIGWVLFLLFVAMMFRMPRQQSIHDLIAGTVVEKRP